VAALVLTAVLVLPTKTDALVDDFEQEFWLPFTHFNLGDRAFAGYADGIAESGERSYHVSINGWALRDFGSAFGYALYRTGGASISRLGISMRVDSVVDAKPSPWDAYAAGISLQLMDSGFASIGTFRYFMAYRPSLSGGRCAASATDVVLHGTQPPQLWIPASRNPSADFRAAPWGAAEFVKVSIGFLCASGLTGAAYSLYFDDFAMDTNAGDSDLDGLEDLLEESRFHVIQVLKAGMPRPILPDGTTVLEIESPRISGPDPAGALDIELVAEGRRLPASCGILASMREGSRSSSPRWDWRSVGTSWSAGTAPSTSTGRLCAFTSTTPRLPRPHEALGGTSRSHGPRTPCRRDHIGSS